LKKECLKSQAFLFFLCQTEPFQVKYVLIQEIMFFSIDLDFELRCNGKEL